MSEEQTVSNCRFVTSSVPELREGEAESPGGAYIDQSVCGVGLGPFGTGSDRSCQATAEQVCPNRGKCDKVAAMHFL